MYPCVASRLEAWSVPSRQPRKRQCLREVGGVNGALLAAGGARAVGRMHRYLVSCRVSCMCDSLMLGPAPRLRKPTIACDRSILSGGSGATVSSRFGGFRGSAPESKIELLISAVFQDALYFVLVSPPHRGSWGRVRTVILLRNKLVWPGSGGVPYFDLHCGPKRSWVIAFQRRLCLVFCSSRPEQGIG